MPFYTEDRWSAVAAIVAEARPHQRLCPTAERFLRLHLERAAERHAARLGMPVESEEEATGRRDDRVPAPLASRAVEQLDKLLRRLDAGRRHRGGVWLDVDALSADARPFVFAALDRRPGRRFTRGMAGSWRAERDRLTTDLAYALPVVREALRDAQAAVGRGMVREVKTTPTGALRAVGGMVPVPKHKRGEAADAFQAELAAIYEVFTGEAAGAGGGARPGDGGRAAIGGRTLGRDRRVAFPRFVEAASSPVQPVTAAGARRREQERPKVDPIADASDRMIAEAEARRARKAAGE